MHISIQFLSEFLGLHLWVKHEKSIAEEKATWGRLFKEVMSQPARPLEVNSLERLEERDSDEGRSGFQMAFKAGLGSFRPFNLNNQLIFQLGALFNVWSYDCLTFSRLGRSAKSIPTPESRIPIIDRRINRPLCKKDIYDHTVRSRTLAGKPQRAKIVKK